MPWYLVGFFLFAILIAIFAVQNAGLVSICFFFWKFPRIPLVLVILGTTLCGLVLGMLIGCFWHRKRVKTSPKSATLDKPGR